MNDIDRNVNNFDSKMKKALVDIAQIKKAKKTEGAPIPAKEYLENIHLDK